MNELDETIFNYAIENEGFTLPKLLIYLNGDSFPMATSILKAKESLNYLVVNGYLRQSAWMPENSTYYVDIQGVAGRALDKNQSA